VSGGRKEEMPSALFGDNFASDPKKTNIMDSFLFTSYRSNESGDNGTNPISNINLDDYSTVLDLTDLYPNDDKSENTVKLRLFADPKKNGDVENK
jgi:hypothetical protein